MAHKIGDQPCAIGRVEHLGVELRAVIAPLVIGDERERSAVAGGDDAEAGGEAGHPVAVAHPHLMPLAHLPQPVEQHAFVGHGEISAAELAAAAHFTRAQLAAAQLVWRALVPRSDLATQLLRQDLLAVADAQDRQPGFEHHVRGAG